MKIKSIKARKILDSRGKPTIEAEFSTGKEKVLASVPSGTSIGKYEAKNLPASKAVAVINKLAKDILKKDFKSQLDFDKYLRSRSKFANVTLPLSIGFCRIFKTLPRSKKLPRLMVLGFEGGAHSDSSLKIQEIMIISKDVNQGLLNYKKLKKALLREKIDTDVGLEGGFAPNDLNDYQAFAILKKCLPVDTKYGIDVGGSYFKTSKECNLQDLIRDFKIVSIEDPFAEKDVKNWQSFFKSFSKKCLIVGDDLVATNIFRLKQALSFPLINAVIVKPNQIGTVSETLEFVKMARKNKLTVIVSHRSGETNDPFIADLAVAVKADFVKFGGMARGERIAKYNRLSELVL